MEGLAADKLRATLAEPTAKGEWHATADEVIETFAGFSLD